MDVCPPYLGRLAHPRLVLTNVEQDGDQPFDHGAAAGFAAVSQVGIDPFPYPLLHVSSLSQVRVGHVDPPVPQFGGHLLTGLQIQLPRRRDLDPQLGG